MARLLIVSRSMALAMRLADQHEVIEHPVDDLEGLGTDLDADVLVLDIGDPMQAVTTVNQLREAGQITPVLLVSGYQPEWEQVEAQQVDGVVVVPLPITRAALLMGISELMGAAGGYVAAEPADEEELLPDDTSSAAGAEDTEPESAAQTAGDQTADAGAAAGEAAADGPEPDEAPADEAAPDEMPAAPAASAATVAVAVEQPSAAEQAAQGALANGTPKNGRGGRGPGGKAPGKAANGRKQGSTQPERKGVPAHDPQHDHQHDHEHAVAGPPTLAHPPDTGESTPGISQPAAAAGPGRAAPPWGTPVEPGPGTGPDLSPVQPGAYAEPLSPPWGETVRVGGPPAGDRDAGQQAPSGEPFRRPAVARSDAPVNRYSGGPDASSAPPAAPERPGQAGPPNGAAAGTGSQGVLGPPSRRLPRLGNRPRKLQRRPNVNDTSGMGLVTDPLGPRTDPYGFPSPAPQTPPGGASSALDRRLDSEAAALLGDRAGPRGRPASGIVMRPADLVQSLLDQVGDLYGVSDTAQVLADDVIERADADAAAILVPDGPIWRVSGGVGLRPLERRLILESSHWLITEIGSAGRAVLIDDTDIIRQQLAGAPLAAWRHLLAVPVPDVRAIVVLARGSEAGPFTDRDLAAVIAPVREAAALLAQAVQTRRLARALSALREADLEAAPRRRD